MPLQIVRDDITKVTCDAIVNAANSSLLGGGGVDGAIHKAAGKELLAECKTLGGCAVGEAKATKAYRLPATYVLHTVGPIWRGGAWGEKEQLTACYHNALQLADSLHCASVAFPLISAGVYGYPKQEAFRIAVDTITAFLTNHDMLVYLVLFDKTVFSISQKLFTDIESFIDDRYVEEHTDACYESMRRSQCSCPIEESDVCLALYMQKVESLEEALSDIDESFSQMVLRKIDEKGMTDAKCYKRANIDRKLFSKIRNNVQYKPKKQTAIALGIALELSLPELQDLLCKAGYALSHSNKFDIIIEYFVKQQTYDVFLINEALFAFDQPLLGL